MDSMTDSTVTMRDWWTGHYLTAARNAYPDLCATHELAVGWKLTHPDGTTHAGYYWPLVNGDHDIPVAHVADNWNNSNKGSCPSRPGDGLCLVESGASSRHHRVASRWQVPPGMCWCGRWTLPARARLASGGRRGWWMWIVSVRWT